MLQEKRKKHIWKSHLNDPDFLCNCLHSFNLMTCNVISCFLLNTTVCSLKATVNWPQRKYQHMTSSPASLNKCPLQYKQISPNTKQKVWLKEQDSIKLQSDCPLTVVRHKSALLHSQLEGGNVPVAVSPLLLKHGLVFSPQCIFCIPFTASLRLALWYTAQHITSLTTASIRCSAVVPKDGTSILRTVFSVNRHQQRTTTPAL